MDGKWIRGGSKKDEDGWTSFVQAPLRNAECGDLKSDHQKALANFEKQPIGEIVEIEIRPLLTKIENTLKLFYSKWRLHACGTFENSLLSCVLRTRFL